MSIDKELFIESLSKRLDPRSGKILPIDKTNESGWRKVLDIEWKGGIHFMVESSKYFWGYSYVMRDGQILSPTYRITRPDDDSIKCMQHVIDDIEDGKYRNKKTLREKIKLFVEENGLASFMNNTKWRELINDIMEKALGIVCSIKLYLKNLLLIISGICAMMRILSIKLRSYRR